MNSFSTQSNQELDLVYQKILKAVDRVSVNEQPQTPTNSPELADKRSTIINNLFEELYMTKKRCGAPNNGPFCDHCLSTLRTPFVPSTNTDNLMGYESHITFLRSIIWLKMEVLTLKDIPVKRIYNIYENMKALWNHDQYPTFNTTDVSSSHIDAVFTEVQRHLQTDIGESKSPVANLPAESSTKFTSLLPDIDEEASQISNPISFGTPSQDDGFEKQQTQVLDDIDDSGLGLRDSIVTNCRQSTKNLTEINKSTIKQKNTKLNETEATAQIDEADCTKQTGKKANETVSSLYVSTTLEHLHINNYAYNVMRVILAVFEDDKTAKSFNSGLLSIQVAADTIVNYIDVLETEEALLSSSNTADFFTDQVMNTISKIFNGLPYEHLTSVQQEFQITALLNFCNCRRICIKTIDFLVNKVCKITSSWQPMKNSPESMDFYGVDLIFHALDMATTKYCEMGQRILQYVNCEPTFNIINSWRELWRRDNKTENLQRDTRQWASEWMTRLKKVLSSTLILVNAECILRIIEKLQALAI